jgi:CheY-like chemotaxis protein
MDMHMSNCDGPTTVRRIRETPHLRSIPIFAVSGSDRREIQEEQQSEVEVQDWFQKPVKTQPLLSAIDDLVTQAMRF